MASSKVDRGSASPTASALSSKALREASSATRPALAAGAVRSARSTTASPSARGSRDRVLLHEETGQIQQVVVHVHGLLRPPVQRGHPGASGPHRALHVGGV